MTCILPWIHVATSASGTLRPCCHAQHNLIPKHPDGRSYRLDRPGDLEAYWNSTEIRNLRKDLIAGKRPEICSRCWREDDAGVRSARQVFNEQFSKELPRQIEDTGVDGSAPLRPVYLDLRFGNLCNLKCRMCGPYSSDRFLDEWNLANPEEALPEEEMKWLSNLRWWDKASSWDALLENIDQVELVYSTGGEPTLAEGFYKFMDLCIEKERASNIIIKINTNLTNFPDRLVDRLVQFKGVMLNLSIDAIGPLARYIRHPSDWKTIERNLRFVDKLAVERKWFGTVHTTVQVLNVTRLIELFDTIKDLKAIDTFPFLNILDHPDYFNIRVLPNSFKQKIAEDLNLWYSKNVKNYCNGSSAVWIEHLPKMVNYMLSENRENLLPKLADRTYRLDNLRDEKLKDILPEIDEILNNYRLPYTKYDKN